MHPIKRAPLRIERSESQAVGGEKRRCCIIEQRRTVVSDRERKHTEIENRCGIGKRVAATNLDVELGDMTWHQARR